MHVPRRLYYYIKPMRVDLLPFQSCSHLHRDVDALVLVCYDNTHIWARYGWLASIQSEMGNSGPPHLQLNSLHVGLTPVWHLLP